MIQALVPVLAPILGKILDKAIPDTAAREQAQAAAMTQLLAHQHEIEQAAGQIIKTEAASTHWLAANWRPLTMLTFCGLIVARWFGFAAPELSEAEYLALWDIVELGLGGYVVGRSAEKIIPAAAAAMRGKP
jgi:hypothetical protein